MVQFENYREKKEEEFAMYKERRLALRNGNYLLFAPWVIFHAFCRLLIFFQNQLFRKILSGIPSVSNTLDPDQAQHFFRSGSKLFAKVNSRRH